MSKTIGKGHCLCGAVKISAPEKSHSVGACHCEMCRRWGGDPLMVVDCGSQVMIEGEEHISIYDSSDWAERAFCSQCGSHLFYRLKAHRQYLVPVGLFAGEEGFVFDHQVFIDDKPSFYEFSNETKNMTGEEAFAMFSASLDEGKV